jgi:hypothetical protein
MINCDEREAFGAMLGKGKLKYSEKPCPNAALYTTNPT